MRDPERIQPLLELVAEVWPRDPDMRLGQFLIFAAKVGGWQGGADIYSVEDDVLEAGLAKLKRNYKLGDTPG